MKDHIVQSAEKKDGSGEKVKAEMENDAVLKNDIKISKEIAVKILAVENKKLACENKSLRCQEIKSRNNNLLHHDTEVILLVNDIDKHITAAQTLVSDDKDDKITESIASSIKTESSSFDLDDLDNSELVSDYNLTDAKDNTPSPSAPELPPDDTVIQQQNELEPGLAIDEHEFKNDIKEIHKSDYTQDEQPGYGAEPLEPSEPGEVKNIAAQDHNDHIAENENFQKNDSSKRKEGEPLPEHEGRPLNEQISRKVDHSRNIIISEKDLTKKFLAKKSRTNGHAYFENETKNPHEKQELDLGAAQNNAENNNLNTPSDSGLSNDEDNFKPRRPGL